MTASSLHAAPAPAPLWFSAEDVFRELGLDECFAAVREAMIAHSAGATRHLLRSFIGLGEGRTFAIMPAALAIDGYFGAKLVSVFADPKQPGRRAHRGVVALFEGETGAPIAFADAEAITHIRTAAASAVATHALARAGASTLGVLGAGRQAEAHVRALSRIRPIRRVIVWGRTRARAEALVASLRDLEQANVELAASPRETVERSDILCTVTGAREPVLKGAWMKPGLHVNLVGSSGPGPREADSNAVAIARYFADCRAHVLEHGAELLLAMEEGRIGRDHIIAEIGEVLDGRVTGRASDADITLYKSLGHAVQDLAALCRLYERRRAGAGQP